MCLDRITTIMIITKYVDAETVNLSSEVQKMISMARHALRRARVTKPYVPKKCPHGHRKHDPAVVCHE